MGQDPGYTDISDLATSLGTNDIPSNIMPSTPSVTSSTPLPTPTSNDEESVSQFFMNKGAMAGVFTAAGVLLIIIGFIIHMAWMRRRRRLQKISAAQGKSRSRAGSPSAFSYVEPPVSISRPSPSLRFSFGSGGVTDRWFTGHKRRSRGGVSQDSTPLRMDTMDRETFKSSDSIMGSVEAVMYRPSGDESELGHIYGRVRGIADSPPPPFTPPPSTVIPAYPPARMGHGRQTTLEDALLPSLSSSSYQVHLSGNHPYAQSP